MARPKKAEEAMFSSPDAAFDEQAQVKEHALEELDIDSFKPRAPLEPQQVSLYSKSKKAGFNADKLAPTVRKKYLDEMRFVKGRFLNHETPSGQIEFHQGPWGEIETHTMMDGATYVVRKFIADYLNNGCRVTQYSDSPVEISPGHKKFVPLLTGGRSRFSFIIEDFVG